MMTFLKCPGQEIQTAYGANFENSGLTISVRILFTIRFRHIPAYMLF